MNTHTDLGDELAEQFMLGTVRSTDDEDGLIQVLDELRSLRDAPAPVPSDKLSAAFVSLTREQSTTGKRTTAAERLGALGVARYREYFAGAAAAVILFALSTLVWDPFAPGTAPNGDPVVAAPVAGVDKPIKNTPEPREDDAPASPQTSSVVPVVASSPVDVPTQGSVDVPETPPTSGPTTPPAPAPEPSSPPVVAPEPEPPVQDTTLLGSVTATVGGVLNTTLGLVL